MITVAVGTRPRPLRSSAQLLAEGRDLLVEGDHLRCLEGIKDLPRFRQLILQLGPPLVQSGPLGRHLRTGIVGPVGPVERRKDGLQRVVVLHGDRVELVIVTLRTLHRDRAKGIHGGGHHVIPVEMPRHLAVDLLLRHLGVPNEVPRPGRDEAGRHDPIHRLGPEHIPRQLLLHESRVGLVLVESSDHVVAIRPGIGTWLVLVVAVRLPVVHHVEPVARPALPVTWPSQQVVDQLLVSPRIVVADEGLHLARRGRQADQVEIQAADQGAPVSLRRERKPVLAMSFHDEAIDRGAGPGRFNPFNLRHRGTNEGLQRPPVPIALFRDRGSAPGKQGHDGRQQAVS